MTGQVTRALLRQVTAGSDIRGEHPDPTTSGLRLPGYGDGCLDSG